MDAMDGLARAIHQRYLAAMFRAGMGASETPALVEWEALPEEYREANRAQARDIVAKMHAIGWIIVPAKDGEAFEPSADELDLLAREEHERWARQRRADGWCYGPVRDDEALRHPMLIPYDDLPVDEQQKDIDAVLEIPALLAAAGLGLRRRSAAEP